MVSWQSHKIWGNRKLSDECWLPDISTPVSPILSGGSDLVDLSYICFWVDCCFRRPDLTVFGGMIFGLRLLGGELLCGCPSVVALVILACHLLVCSWFQAKPIEISFFSLGLSQKVLNGLYYLFWLPVGLHIEGAAGAVLKLVRCWELFELLTM